MTSMLLVRHGQSEWNATGRWQGQADPPLSDLGRQQALDAAARVGSVDVVVSSGLMRALETARIIADQVGVGPVVVEPDLRERHVGEWSGLTHVEIEAAYPGHLADGRRPPGWEHDDDAVARLRGALDRIHAEYEGADVLVLSHGGVIRALEIALGGPSDRLPNLGGRQLTHRGDRLVLGERVLLVDADVATVPTQI
jgi:broad specificity phosphatase PhoE